MKISNEAPIIEDRVPSPELRLWQAVLLENLQCACWPVPNSHRTDFDIAHARRFLLSEDGVAVALTVGLDERMFRQGIKAMRARGWTGPIGIAMRVKRASAHRTRGPAASAQLQLTA